MKNIVTIMNFARGVDHRNQDILFPTTQKQFELLHGSGLKSTFLLQHDAVIDPAYVALFKGRDDDMELGLWLEVCRSLVMAADVRWRGRDGYLFDWFANTDTVTGYTEAEKCRLIDTAMHSFKAAFGDYPKTVGAWVLDSFTLARLKEVYGVVAACICKDQWGTDGYTLFGGYYDNAYYPCKKNALCPAQTKEEQIDLPVFRLLGCDPIYQYDCYLRAGGDVITLEPWKFDKDSLPAGGGADPRWVDWYFREVFESGRGGAFNYAQVGQENSFFWDGMKDGLLYQVACVKDLKAKGVIEDMTFSQAGQWVLNTFAMSAACTHTALTDWRGEDNRSVWYYCKNYRINLMMTADALYIRDWQLYDEQYPSRYNDDHLCTEPACFFDVPCAMNGVAWSDDRSYAGIYLADAVTGVHLTPTNVRYEERDNGFSLSFTAAGRPVCIRGDETTFTVKGEGIALAYEYAHVGAEETLHLAADTAFYTKRGYPYTLVFEGGRFDGKLLRFKDNITVRF